MTTKDPSIFTIPPRFNSVFKKSTSELIEKPLYAEPIASAGFIPWKAIAQIDPKRAPIAITGIEGFLNTSSNTTTTAGMTIQMLMVNVS